MQENERVEGELAGNLFPSLGCFGTHYNAGLMVRAFLLSIVLLF